MEKIKKLKETKNFLTLKIPDSCWKKPKKYEGFPDKPQYEEVHFRAYCLLKTGLLFDLIRAGLRKQEEFESALYPFYLKEKKKSWKDIQNIEKIGKEIIDKILTELKGGKK